jgi:UPF0042 nucleotide-binding protein
VRRLARVREIGELPLTLLFFECDDEVLRRRYSETRRRHPMAMDRPVTDGIRRERRFMAPLKAAADLVYDTTTSSTAELRQWVVRHFGSEGESPLTVSVVSFAFRHGVPREADIVLDVRFLSNPHYVEPLRPLTGLDHAVQEHVRRDPDLAPTLERFLALILPLLPRYRAEGKSYLTIAIGCTGGRHRSVFVAERVAKSLRDQGWETTTIHRDLPRSAAG